MFEKPERLAAPLASLSGRSRRRRRRKKQDFVTFRSLRLCERILLPILGCSRPARDEVGVAQVFRFYSDSSALRERAQPIAFLNKRQRTIPFMLAPLRICQTLQYSFSRKC